MRKKSEGLKLNTVLVLIIFCVFAVSAMLVLALGGNIYKNIAKISNERYYEQTSLPYIWTKIKTGDSIGRVYVEDFHGLPALCIEEELDGSVYKTLVYHYDGWIRELFFELGLEFAPEDGLPILEGESLEVKSLDDGLILAAAGEERLFISLQSKTYERSRQD